MSRFRKKREVIVKKPLSKVDQALKLSKRNAKTIREQVDLKVTDLVVTEIALAATPAAATYIVGNSVDGNKVKVKSIQIKGVVKQNLTSALIDDYRLDLVMDRMPNKTIITPLLYLGDATPTVLAYKDFGSKGRYRIIKTWSGYLSSPEGSNSFRKINYFKSLNIMQTSETANTMSQASIIRNAFYLVMWTTASANQPTFEGNIRMVFQDGDG